MLPTGLFFTSRLSVTCHIIMDILKRYTYPSHTICCSKWSLRSCNFSSRYALQNKRPLLKIAYDIEMPFSLAAPISSKSTCIGCLKKFPDRRFAPLLNKIFYCETADTEIDIVNTTFIAFI